MFRDHLDFLLLRDIESITLRGALIPLTETRVQIKTACLSVSPCILMAPLLAGMGKALTV